jgi:hypothetical protein
VRTVAPSRAGDGFLAFQKRSVREYPERLTSRRRFAVAAAIISSTKHCGRQHPTVNNRIKQLS